MGAQTENRYYTVPEYSRTVAEAKRDALCRWMAEKEISPARLRDFEAMMMGGQVGDGLFLDCQDPLSDTGFAGLRAGSLGWRRVARAELVVRAFRASLSEAVVEESDVNEFRKQRFKV